MTSMVYNHLLDADLKNPESLASFMNKAVIAFIIMNGGGK